MTLSIAIESPLSADGLALIEGSEVALRQVFTVDECFSFDAEKLTGEGITFFVARENGSPLGCIALIAHDGYAEIKRLFVSPQARGTGAGRKLVQHLETAAVQKGISQIRLESGEKLAAAVSLYTKLGYTKRGPFGDYIALPASLFMEKHL